MVSHPVPIQKLTSPDRLEAAGQIGFGPRPTRPLDLAWRDVPIWIEPRQKLPVWIRLSAYNDVDCPLSSRSVRVKVIDAAGKVMRRSDASVTPTILTTRKDGYAKETTFFSASTFGIYRIAFEYKDNKTLAVSYSQPILVFSRDQALPDEMGIGSFEHFSRDNRERRFVGFAER